MAHYYETVNDVQVKKIVCKFLLSRQSEIYYIGCNRVYTRPKSSVPKSAFPSILSKIDSIAQTKPPPTEEASGCQGDFCKYKIMESIKYELWKKRQRPEVKAFFSLIIKPPSSTAPVLLLFSVIHSYRSNNTWKCRSST
ncbi:MAG: hypothetical protein P4M11_14535 [Candidatus Pacebacteria bacterium]|nr:hypothetical protein [Candidatus Paceibacterota bacterium]